MPYQKIDELPDAVKALPAHGQEIWMAAFNSAWDQYKGDEEKCFATAWAAVKEKYRREEDKWVPFGDGEPWIEVFSTGWHTDSNERKNFWTEADLKEIATLYNPKHHRAPITIGHPENDAPAYGWIVAAKFEEDKLLLMPEQVDPWLKEEVRKGHYGGVSMGLYPDLGIRHLGFLGAVPPAVKGLKRVTFAEKAAWIFESAIRIPQSAFSEADKQAQESRSKKYNIAIKDGGNVTKPSEWENVSDDDFLDPVNYRYPCPNADQTRAAASYWGHPDNQAQYSSEEKAIINRRLEEKEKQFKIGLPAEASAKAGEHNEPSYAKAMAGKGGMHMDLGKFFSDLKALIVGAEKELTPDPDRKFTEADIQAKVKEAKDLAFAETEKLKKEKAEADRKLKEIEDKARKDGIAAFCETLCKEGKLTPALRKIIEPIMEVVAEIQSMPGSERFQTVQFSEGVKKPALDGIKDFLTELPKVVTFKEVAGGAGPGSGGNAGEKLSALTKQKMEAKKDLSYGAAFSEVQKENPELAKELLEEIRPGK